MTMAIRLGNSCSNCERFTADHQCQQHEVTVDAHYTCDSFQLKESMKKDDPNCTTCARFETSTCAHQSKASVGMLCASWAPMSA